MVTLVERALGALGTPEAAVLIGAQVAGGALGAVVANLMFALPAVALSDQQRTGGGLWLGEVVATLGLVLVVFGVVRAGRAPLVAFAVGGYITAAYWFTSSTNFANPAVTVARTRRTRSPASLPARWSDSCSRSWPAARWPTRWCACCTRRRPPSPRRSPRSRPHPC